MSSEFKYTVVTTVALVFCMLFKGGRVLVPPLLFVLALVLVFWAAKPRAEE